MISEEQLRVYTKPASDSEELQCDRSTRMIRAAMEEFQGLKGRRYKIIRNCSAGGLAKRKEVE